MAGDNSLKIEDLTKKLKSNPWMATTIILGLVIILTIGFSWNCKLTGNVVSKDAAGTMVVDYINTIAPSEVELVSVEDLGGIYEVTVLYESEEIPLYVSKDGKYWTSMIQSLQPEQTAPVAQAADQSIEVPKSDKPVVELFVMSHCPYGTQAEKGIIPAVELLKDNIDFKLRFVYYAMHPNAGEVQEQLNQYCIQKEQSIKLISYLKCFLDKGEGETCLTTASIDKTKLKACTDAADLEFEVSKNLNDQSLWLSGSFPLFNIDADLNQQYGIQGSPTLVINGVQASSARSPAAYLESICNAFNNAPSECSQTLSSESYSPGFGYSTGSSTDASCG
jgi:hypothetical protein